MEKNRGGAAGPGLGGSEVGYEGLVPNEHGSASSAMPGRRLNTWERSLGKGRGQEITWETSTDEGHRVWEGENQ